MAMGRLGRRDIGELVLVALAFLFYYLVRGAVVDRPATAYAHARDVVDFERWLGVYWEPALNRWANDRLFWAQTMNIVYFWLHFPLIIAFGIWLYYARRGTYVPLRDAFLSSGALALIVYWLYPVAPPRELPALAASYDAAAPSYITGFTDTMREYLGYAYQTQSTRPFVNPYAAMPSLHFGWDLLLGAGVIWTFWRERWLCVAAPIGIALPLLQLFSITMTANHFFLDAAAGGAVAVAGVGVAWAFQRWLYPTLAVALARLRGDSAASNVQR